MRENKGRVAGGRLPLFLIIGAQGGELTMLKRWRFVIIAVALFSLVLPSAQALEPVKKYQIDVIAVPTALGTPNVTEQMSRAIIEKVNAGFIDATGGLIQFTFRTLYPVPNSVVALTASSQIKVVTGLSPTPDPGFERVILIGVITKNPALGFAGQAGGNQMLINMAWDNWQVPGIVVHELGHNLGLGHANSAVCTTGLPMICQQKEYADASSIMGNYQISYVANPFVARFSAAELNILGVLPDPEIIYAPVSGTYKLSPVYSKNSQPRLLYIPIASQNVYAVEYRAATGSDLGLSQSWLTIPNSNSYYTNMLSYGLQLRILNVGSNSYDNIKPSSTGFNSFETALVSYSFTDPQIIPTGKIFTLSDGTTVEIISQDPILGATVKVVRPVDTEAPKIENPRLNWGTGSSYSKKEIISVKRKNSTTWDYPAFETNAIEVIDNQSVKEIQLEVNGVIVDQKNITSTNPEPKLKYQTESLGDFAVRVVATDFSGNKSFSELIELNTVAYIMRKASIDVGRGEDPYSSLRIEVEAPENDVSYQLTNLSAGIISSVIKNNDLTIFNVTGLKDGSDFTATLTGMDSLGNTDGGQEIKSTTKVLSCTDKVCYVGKTWNLDVGYWSNDSGILTLQERVSGRWKKVKSASPIIDNSGPKNYPKSYRLSVTYTKPGKYEYRFQIAAVKKGGIYTSRTFIQTVTQR